MIYYMSATGNDSNDGLTEATPWKTITSLNTKFTAGSIGKGSAVLFKAGDTFYGKIRPPSGMNGITAGFLTIGAYGSTAGQTTRPEISSYKLLNTSGGWTLHASNVWKVNLSNANAGVTHTGYDGVQGGGSNIGFLRVDGAIKGAKKWALGDLATQWDFYCDTAATTLYVRSTANPTTLATDIRAATDGAAIQSASALQVIGLKLIGSGGHGIAGGAATGMRIYDCEIAEIGGSQLVDTTRYGNGVENYGTSSDIVVEHNEFRDVYDVAYTAQGPSPSVWTNITVRNNLMYRCGQALEFWADGATNAAQGFKNVLIEDNVSLFMGYSWGAPVRADANRGVHILTYLWTQPANIVIRRNVFYDADTAYRYTAAGNPTTGITYTDNMIFLRAGKPIMFQTAQTIEQWSAWTSAQSTDTDSQFFVLPATAPTTVDAALQHIASAEGLASGWIRTLGRGLRRAHGLAELARATAVEPATDVQIPATSGVASVDTPTPSFIGSFTPLMLFSATALQAMSYVVRTPPGWNAFDVYLRVVNTVGGTGNAVWRLLAGRKAIGDAMLLSDHDGGNLTRAAGGQSVMEEFRIGTGLAADPTKEVVIRIERDGAAGADTFASAYGLVSVVLRRA